MKRLKLSALDLDSLQSVVDIEEHPIADYPWLDVDHIVLREDEQQQIEAIVHCLRKSSTNLFNEATIWGKAIFPLFLLAEQGNIEAWTEVPLSAQYAQFELDGIADGVLGRGIAGRITAPYLVMVEAKRGIDGENPIFRLYGQILCGAWQNWRRNRGDPSELGKANRQEIFGCYTIGQTWQFVRAEVAGFEDTAAMPGEAHRPMLWVEYSQEYPETTEAERIVRIPKSVVQRHLADAV
ncbi:MAG: hypothetical protein HC771_01900 [Synechococcales cyanobacterium CRU_2_2]|nr:hypothetical protein [Synechococcales cyanobacterium CRU_2_2]